MGFLGHCSVSQKSLIHAIAGPGQIVHLVMAGQGSVDTTGGSGSRGWQDMNRGILPNKCSSPGFRANLFHVYVCAYICVCVCVHVCEGVKHS